ncbi:hypothetical protein H2199_007575 [Coniosporium tulheliwenetii]|uniref:Uncharacterized protein n=1 Tax=Coniosporium tulheliwenetii TaxID=3383036 RepID=A0ACC2YPI2_9PEZI|nr:hypothetical protein H2199_007575 [Cladosporium sp. JES 115]
MTDIYADAKTVLIYLGEQEENTQHAFKLLKQIYDASWTADWDLLEVVSQAINTRGLAVVDHTVYKEQATAKELQQGLAQLSKLMNFKEHWKHSRRLQLMDLVYHFQTARATDPRDHLFALLGLAAEAGALDLSPNYSSPLAETMERYARHLLGRKRVLRFFAVLVCSAVSLTSRRRTREMATKEILHSYLAGSVSPVSVTNSDGWQREQIPNWYGAHDTFAYEYAEGPWDPLRRPRFFDAAPGTTVQIIEPSEPGVLRIRGACVDSIWKLANEHLNYQGQMTKDVLFEQKRLHVEESDAIMREIRSYPTREDLGEVQ